MMLRCVILFTKNKSQVSGLVLAHDGLLMVTGHIVPLDAWNKVLHNDWRRGFLWPMLHSDLVNHNSRSLNLLEMDVYTKILKTDYDYSSWYRVAPKIPSGALYGTLTYNWITYNATLRYNGRFSVFHIYWGLATYLNINRLCNDWTIKRFCWQ